MRGVRAALSPGEWHVIQPRQILRLQPVRELAKAVLTRTALQDAGAIWKLQMLPQSTRCRPSHLYGTLHAADDAPSKPPKLINKT
jgi:hypothetical protein